MFELPKSELPANISLNLSRCHHYSWYETAVMIHLQKWTLLHKSQKEEIQMASIYGSSMKNTLITWLRKK